MKFELHPVPSSTLREEIASCSEKAYERLRISDAKRLMMLDSEKEVREYAEEVSGFLVRETSVSHVHLSFSDGEKCTHI